jgi:hypothetical protein
MPPFSADADTRTNFDSGFKAKASLRRFVCALFALPSRL